MVSVGSAQVAVRNNPEELRYELEVDGEVAGEIRYRLYPDRIVLVHTEVSPALEGQGLASRLVADALDDIRSRRLRVVPVCPFVREYIRRHPEYNALVTGDLEVGD
jgi:predicted GNAT family acetyltransferase